MFFPRELYISSSQTVLFKKPHTGYMITYDNNVQIIVIMLSASVHLWLQSTAAMKVYSYVKYLARNSDLSRAYKLKTKIINTK